MVRTPYFKYNQRLHNTANSRNATPFERRKGGVCRMGGAQYDTLTTIHSVQKSIMADAKLNARPGHSVATCHHSAVAALSPMEGQSQLSHRSAAVPLVQGLRPMARRSRLHALPTTQDRCPARAPRDFSGARMIHHVSKARGKASLANSSPLLDVESVPSRIEISFYIV